VPARGRAGAHLVREGGQAQRHALPGVALGLAVQRLVLAELFEQQHGRKLGPAQPRGVTWNGAGAWLIASQSRQENVSRTCRISFHRRGNHLQRLGDVLARLGQTPSAADRAGAGAGSTTRSRGRCAGSGWRKGRLRVKPVTVVVLAAAISAAISSSLALASNSSSCSSS